MLISSGSSNYEVSLLNLETSSVEVLLSVDDRRNKDSILSGLPVIPSFLKEGQFQVPDYDYGQVIKQNETNSSIMRRYLQTNSNSQHFNKLLSY